MTTPVLAEDTNALPSHCSGTERVIFSCEIKSSGKYLSVCASKSLDGEDKYVQYRFGSLGATEFEFPAVRARSVEKFKINHYFRAQVDRRDLIFMNKDVRYMVFSHFEGEEKPSLKEAGVTVQKGKADRNWKTLKCTSSYIDHLEDLDNVVESD
jgi:hypothetical protein